MKEKTKLRIDEVLNKALEPPGRNKLVNNSGSKSDTSKSKSSRSKTLDKILENYETPELSDKKTPPKERRKLRLREAGKPVGFSSQNANQNERPSKALFDEVLKFERKLQNRMDGETQTETQEVIARIKKNFDSLPKAAYAEYDNASKLLILTLQNGVTVSIPIQLIFGLNTKDDKALNDFELMLEGSQIHWHTLDAQFYIKSVLEGVLDNKSISI